MTFQIFSVYDIKSDVYGVPFFMPSVGTAVRAFADLANDPQSQVTRYPTEFVLRRIGTFDDSTATFCGAYPENFGFASEYIRKDNVEPIKLAEVRNG